MIPVCHDRSVPQLFRWHAKFPNTGQQRGKSACLSPVSTVSLCCYCPFHCQYEPKCQQWVSVSTSCQIITRSRTRCSWIHNAHLNPSLGIKRASIIPRWADTVFYRKKRLSVTTYSKTNIGWKVIIKGSHVPAEAHAADTQHAAALKHIHKDIHLFIIPWHLKNNQVCLFFEC